MKRILTAALAGLVALSAFGQAKALPDLKGRTIRAATSNDSPPLNFLDPATKKSAGWEYDAVNEIARRLNAKISWSVASWDAVFQGIRDGQFDVGMDGFTITEERRQQVDFSEPYMRSQQFMLVRKGENRFTTAKDLAANAKLMIGSQAGTTSFYAAVYNVLDGDESSPRVKLFKTLGATVQALLAGEVDCVLIDAATGKGYTRANPDKLAFIGEPLATEDYGFIFKRTSDLVAPFNAALTSMKDDGTLEKLTARWFTEYTTK